MICLMKVIFISLLYSCYLKHFFLYIPKRKEAHFQKVYNNVFCPGSPSVYSGVSNDNNDDMYEDYHDNAEAEHRETEETELMRTPDFVSVPQVFGNII